MLACMTSPKLRLAKDDLRTIKIEEWFRNDQLPDIFKIPQPYRNCKILNVIMCSPNADQRYYLISVNSSYCLNLNASHKNNSVYFTLNHMGLFQKCFCRCATTQGRLWGRCENFTSEKIEIPDDIIGLLFSDDDAKRSKYLETILKEEQKYVSNNEDRWNLLLDKMIDKWL
jgi:hypothetical protein